MGQRNLTNSPDIGSGGTHPRPRRAGHKCGTHGHDRNYPGNGRQGYGSRDIRRAVASCGGQSPSVVNDAPATRCAGRAAAPEYVGDVHCPVVGHAAVDRSGPGSAAVERAVAAGSAPASAVAEHAVLFLLVLPLLLLTCCCCFCFLLLLLLSMPLLLLLVLLLLLSMRLFLSLLFLGFALLVFTLLLLGWSCFSPCCSCCAEAGAAIPRSKDRMAVLVILIAFHICYPFHYRMACLALSASFQLSRLPGCRWLRRIQEAPLSGSAAGRWSYRWRLLAKCCRNLWPETELVATPCCTR